MAQNSVTPTHSIAFDKKNELCCSEMLDISNTEAILVL